ncbi:MAG: Asp-tRNA(Asn)/Glu-tRNA(Gln) amidotransferase subunit GatC [Patescibacteria group bacterium]|nr:Asp-tRNA(Asn)/Glu-tRNA(Gln) amidotransferase subunit GatC [Patescibacteria group bacterium]
MISKKDLENLAELARIELKESEEKKLLKDLESILKHFDELKEANTKKVKPMTGGTFLENIFRSDESLSRLDPDGAIKQFPEKTRGFLKVPPVFE